MTRDPLTIRCKKCETTFKVSREYWERAGIARALVYCPNGHSFIPPKPDILDPDLLSRIFDSPDFANIWKKR